LLHGIIIGILFFYIISAGAETVNDLLLQQQQMTELSHDKFVNNLRNKIMLPRGTFQTDCNEKKLLNATHLYL